jgi:hypothetical protein
MAPCHFSERLTEGPASGPGIGHPAGRLARADDPDITSDTYTGYEKHLTGDSPPLVVKHPKCVRMSRRQYRGASLGHPRL